LLPLSLPFLIHLPAPKAFPSSSDVLGPIQSLRAQKRCKKIGDRHRNSAIQKIIGKGFFFDDSKFFSICVNQKKKKKIEFFLNFVFLYMWRKKVFCF
jgi:hypothetical protein